MMHWGKGLAGGMPGPTKQGKQVSLFPADTWHKEITHRNNDWERHRGRAR